MPERLPGEVPWRYLRGLPLRGYVRLDYAPFWFACGRLFETAQAELNKLDRPARRTVRLSGRGAGAASAERRPRAAAVPQP